VSDVRPLASSVVGKERTVVAATELRPRPVVGDPATNGGPSEHRITPRRGLPGGRAVLGGLLVAVAAIGIFVAVTGSGDGPGTAFVVAARDLDAGTVLGADDLRTVPMDLPHSVQGRAFTQVSDVTGAVTVGPLSAGELVQAGGLTTGTDVPTFSVSLPEADADAGSLVRGDRVQVFATYGSDTSGTTEVLSQDATVVSVRKADDSVTATGEVVVRLAVRSAEERSAIINATVTGRLALVRVTGATDVGAHDRFRPELDEDTAASGSATTAPDADDGGTGTSDGTGPGG
jgi:Flp pilus assembly protein CpaB